MTHILHFSLADTKHPISQDMELIIPTSYMIAAVNPGICIDWTFIRQQV